MIEVFPELRQRCVTHDLSSVRLINADFIAEADFLFRLNVSHSRRFIAWLTLGCELGTDVSNENLWWADRNAIE